MSKEVFFSKYEQLSENRQEEANDFVEFLLSKQEKEEKKRKPKFGSMKGAFVLKENFDDPLEDLKDYM